MVERRRIGVVAAHQHGLRRNGRRRAQKQRKRAEPCTQWPKFHNSCLPFVSQSPQLMVALEAPINKLNRWLAVIDVGAALAQGRDG